MAAVAELQRQLSEINAAITWLLTGGGGGIPSQEVWEGGADRWRGVSYADLVKERQRLEGEIARLDGSDQGGRVSVVRIVDV